MALSGSSKMLAKLTSTARSCDSELRKSQNQMCPMLFSHNLNHQRVFVRTDHKLIREGLRSDWPIKNDLERGQAPVSHSLPIFKLRLESSPQSGLKNRGSSDGPDRPLVGAGKTITPLARDVPLMSSCSCSLHSFGPAASCDLLITSDKLNLLLLYRDREL